MSRFVVKHTPDRFKAFLTVVDAGDATFPTLQEIQTCLREHGVVHGVDMVRCKEIVDNKIMSAQIEIARGSAVKEGRHGRLELLVDNSKMGRPRERKDGSVDHRELNYVLNVRKGTPIARRIPPVPSQDGTDVFGQPIKAVRVRDVQLPVGPGTEISGQDANMLMASIDGAVTIKVDGQIEVTNERIIHSDIDYSTGNIVFNGDLIVRGAVRAGFEISCDGNCFIGGVVEDTKVVAGADLEVKGGAAGSGKGALSAGGNLKIRYAENFNLNAGKDVIAAEDVIHCKTTTHGVVRARSIVGGVTTTDSGVEATRIGNDSEVKTVIDIGGQFVLVGQKDACLKQMTRLVTEIGFAREAIYILVRDSMDEAGTIEHTALAKLESLKSNNGQRKTQIADLQKKIDEVSLLLANCPVPVIKAQMVFPNTIVRYGPREKMIKEPTPGALIYPKEDNIIIGKGS